VSPYTHTNRTTSPVPYSCEECRQNGSPHAILVFPVGGEWPVPECRYHKDPIPMIRSKFYDAEGNKIKEVK
jgi:hypothetical protein